MRPLWPYVKDKLSIASVAEEKPFEVAACWNGATVFPAKPYTYYSETPVAQPPLSRRGWRMMDNGEENSSAQRMSLG